MSSTRMDIHVRVWEPSPVFGPIDILLVDATESHFVWQGGFLRGRANTIWMVVEHERLETRLGMRGVVLNRLSGSYVPVSGEKLQVCSAPERLEMVGPMNYSIESLPSGGAVATAKNNAFVVYGYGSDKLGALRDLKKNMHERFHSAFQVRWTPLNNCFLLMRRM